MSAYWGYLSDGGLVLDGHYDLREGQPVAVNVYIESSRRNYEVSGVVVKRRPDASRGNIVVAFDAGQSDRFLSGALAGASVNVEASARDLDARDASLRLRLIDVSRQGCTLELTEATALPVGSGVSVKTAAFEIVGTVVWSMGDERGVMFALDDDTCATRALNVYVATLS